MPEAGRDLRGPARWGSSAWRRRVPAWRVPTTTRRTPARWPRSRTANTGWARSSSSPCRSSPRTLSTRASPREFAYTFHFSDSFGLEVRGGYAVDFDTGLKSQLLQLGTAAHPVPGDPALRDRRRRLEPDLRQGHPRNHTVLHGEFFFVLGGGAFEEVSSGGLGNFYPAPNWAWAAAFSLEDLLAAAGRPGQRADRSTSFDNVLDVNLGISLNFLAPE